MLRGLLFAVLLALAVTFFIVRPSSISIIVRRDQASAPQLKPTPSEVTDPKSAPPRLAPAEGSSPPAQSERPRASPAPLPVPQTTAPAALPPAPSPPLDRQAIAALLTRGEELMNSGDVGAARLVLQRAADAGEPRAELALGATYDPIMLDRYRIRGRPADVAKARAWYEKAQEHGLDEAQRRLDMLASRAHVQTP
jgi:hypothetical protein